LLRFHKLLSSQLLARYGLGLDATAAGLEPAHMRR